jgi:hypothetical protein
MNTTTRTPTRQGVDAREEAQHLVRLLEEMRDAEHQAMRLTEQLASSLIEREGTERIDAADRGRCDRARVHTRQHTYTATSG